jgi:hypothetical protein
MIPSSESPIPDPLLPDRPHDPGPDPSAGREPLAAMRARVLAGGLPGRPHDTWRHRLRVVRRSARAGRG